MCAICDRMSAGTCCGWCEPQSSASNCIHWPANNNRIDCGTNVVSSVYQRGEKVWCYQRCHSETIVRWSYGVNEQVSEKERDVWQIYK